MMNIMMFGPGPKGQEMMQTPRKLVPAMRIDGLEQAQDNPRVHGEDVQVARDGTPQDGRAYGAEAEDHDFDRRGVFGGEAEGRGVLVVDLVDVFVQRTPVQGAVRPVVPGVFQHEEDGDLVGHC